MRISELIRGKTLAEDDMIMEPDKVSQPGSVLGGMPQTAPLKEPLIDPPETIAPPTRQAVAVSQIPSHGLTPPSPSTPQPKII